MINSKVNEPSLKKSKDRDGTDQTKILLVDNLKDNLLALEWLLKRDDVEIFKANSGNDALELMVPHEFALALIDVNMPGMSGFELAELMRGTNQTKNIPIIFVTATAKDQSFSFKGYESGAVDFLLKPLDTHAVKSKVSIFIEFYRQKRSKKHF
jgi:response regulator RpfG family c-di-GMP phosphodiesterase